MSINLHLIKTQLRNLWVYGISFILIFDLFFLKTFSDSSQTYGIFLVVSVLLAVLTMLLFLLVSAVFPRALAGKNLLVNFVILFLLSELSVLIIAGDISCFGLFEYTRKDISALDLDLTQFRKARDLALSTSAMLSCAVYILALLFSSRRKKSE